MNSKIIYVIKEKYAVLVSIIVIAWGVVLCFHSLSASYYLNEVNGGLVIFIASSFLSVAAGVGIVKAVGAENYGILLATLTSFFQIITATAMPLLFYTSGYSNEDVIFIAKACMYNIMLFFVTAVLFIAVLISIEKLIASRFRLYALTCILFAAMIILTALTCAFSSNQSTIVFGVQVGFLFVGLFMLNFAVFFELNGWFQLIPVTSTLIGIACMIVKGETGLVTFFIIAAFSHFLFFYRKKTKAQVIISLVFVVIAVVVVSLLYIYAETNSSFAPAWVDVLANKISNRINYKENYHIIKCLESLNRSHFIGNGTDYVYIYGGTSDFAVTSALRYIGFIILPLILISTVLFAFAFAHRFSKKTVVGENFLYNTAIISFCIILVMIFYNTAMNVSGAPVIGVSGYSAGLGKMHNTFCGFLFGAILAKNCRFKSSWDFERMLKNE